MSKQVITVSCGCCGVCSSSVCPDCASSIVVALGAICSLIPAGRSVTLIPDPLHACTWYGSVAVDQGTMDATISCVNGSWVIAVTLGHQLIDDGNGAGFFSGQWTGTLNSATCPATCVATDVVVVVCTYTDNDGLHTCACIPTISVTI